MYNRLKRLDRIFEKSEEIAFDDSSRFIFFSDCHRGDGSWADNFLSNKQLFMAALDYYHKHGYTYIEIGDGDELWENRHMTDIVDSHQDVFKIMQRFYTDNRFYMLYGNHDIVKQRKSFMKKNLYHYYNYHTGKYEPLFEGMECREGLILKHEESQNRIFVLHGHQVDFLNDRLWALSRFLVRYLWKPLELHGLNNPASPAKNHSMKGSIEKSLIEWVKKNNKIIIAGHTHHPMFPKDGEASYFNSGSCVHPDCITGIEIYDSDILLVKWCIKVGADGVLYAAREILRGPRRLESFFNTSKSKINRDMIAH